MPGIAYSGACYSLVIFRNACCRRIMLERAGRPEHIDSVVFRESREDSCTISKSINEKGIDIDQHFAKDHIATKGETT